MASNTSVFPLKQAVCTARSAASGRIRERLVKAKQRFHANDNIAAFIQEGELDELRVEVQSTLQEVLHALVIDTIGDHNSVDTARRMAKMFVDEVFRGRYEPAPPITTFPNVSRLDELMTVGPIKVRSACAHHLCPIVGKVWVGVLPSPSSELIGLSKYARLCNWVLRRPQIQEEAIVMLADELERYVKPDGLAVVMETSHFCMQWRGVKEDESLMRNTIMRGAFSRNVELRREFLDLVDNRAS